MPKKVPISQSDAAKSAHAYYIYFSSGNPSASLNGWDDGACGEPSLLSGVYVHG